jgi:membrane fusion protein (multidrug efflux system)
LTPVSQSRSLYLALSPSFHSSFHWMVKLYMTTSFTSLLKAKLRAWKPILLGLAGLILIFLVLAGLRAQQINVLMSTDFSPPPESVSVFVVEEQFWPNVFTATGTVEADEGVVISAEVAGKVQRIAFNSGDYVEAGTLLIEQESGNERAQLKAAEARLNLARSNYERLEQLRERNTISQSDLDTAYQQMVSSQADVEDLKTTLEKKVVRAPFSGRLGIRQVDLGKDLLVGNPIVSLQATNRVRVNFPVPQNWLVQMTRGQHVSVRLADGHVAEGVITAIGAEINPVTRNAIVQSVLENPGQRLIPGMAVETRVTLSDPIKVMAVPATAIIYAPYGDTVFVVKEDEQGQLKAQQQFVRLGKSQGDFVEVVNGLDPGDRVVSAGAFKLNSGQSVFVTDLPTPEFNQEPTPADN